MKAIPEPRRVYYVSYIYFYIKEVPLPLIILVSYTIIH